MDSIKAITLWQPWASLIRPEPWGKKIETRSWATTYRGPLAIHSSKYWGDEARAVVDYDSFADALGRLDVEDPENDLPRGAILCVCRLVACVPVGLGRTYTYARHDGTTAIVPPPHGSNERWFGLYCGGRYAWVLDDIHPLPAPIYTRGAQGLWECQDWRVLTFARACGFDRPLPVAGLFAGVAQS